MYTNKELGCTPPRTARWLTMLSRRIRLDATGEIGLDLPLALVVSIIVNDEGSEEVTDFVEHPYVCMFLSEWRGSQLLSEESAHSASDPRCILISGYSDRACSHSMSPCLGRGIFVSLSQVTAKRCLLRRAWEWSTSV